MNILITGGAGFIGSALIRLAIAKGYNVINIDALKYSGHLENLKSVENHPNYFFEKIDILNIEAISAVFNKYLPDAVMHLAAETHVDRSIDDPKNFIEANIVGTFNMLEASRKYWNKKGRLETFRFIHISTDEVYGSLEINSKKKFTEYTNYDPSSPYSASKASSDLLALSWNKTFKLPIVISNCSNNYGPYQFPEKLIPLLILNAINGNPLPIYGNGSNVRDWLYVDDHVEALLLILEKGYVGRSYNVGGENELTNLEVAKILCSKMDYLRPIPSKNYSKLIKFVEDRPGHDARYAIDISRIRKELGWAPKVTFEIGIEKTISWFLNNESWWQPLIKKKDAINRLGGIDK